jgi:hypothetical protein
MKRILATMATVLLVTGCAVSTGGGGSTSVGQQSPTAQPTATEDGTEETPTPEPTLHVLKASDLELTIKETSKHCFGSAGCNVEYKVKVAFAIPDPGELAGDYDVTFRIKGDEDGPITDTITVYSDGKYDVSEGYASTPSSHTKLSAKVTDVEEQ